MRKYDFTLDLDTPNSNSLILKCIKPGSTVLEFGPAHGRMTKYLKEKLECKVTIVELDSESGSEAAKYSERALIGEIEGNIESGYWAKQLKGIKFDYIIFADVLEHLHKPSEVLGKATKLMTEDGSIVVSVPNLCHNSILIELWKNRFEYRSIGLLDETHLHFFSKVNLTKIVHQNGLHAHVAHYVRNMVENTEFNHSLAELPPEVAKAMAKREHADVYHLVWELKRAPWLKPGALPKVSVLLPTYNYGEYLPAAIESVLSQDLPDFELIISDDASDDFSAEIIRSYAARDQRIRFKIHEVNQGMVANWNWCLEQARGEYIKFIFGDDRLACSNALSTLATMLDSNPRAVISTSARQIIDSNDEEVDFWSAIKQNGLNKGPTIARHCLFTIQNAIGEPTAVMFRKSATVGRRFDPTYRQIVDLEMWLHLLKSGDLVYTDKALCHFRRHDRQQTATNSRAQIGYHEHVRLAEEYTKTFLHSSSHLTFREKRLLARVLHSLERGKDIPESARLLTPYVRSLLGNWLWFFRFSRSFFRPFENACRAWRKYVRRDPALNGNSHG
ncbi:MAG: glycosyltransferase [Nibricoccus sp.]